MTEIGSADKVERAVARLSKRFAKKRVIESMIGSF